MSSVPTRSARTCPERSRRVNQKLDVELQQWAARKLDEDYPYLILDARYEKVRENGVICSRAVLVALGINWEERRRVLAVELVQPRERHQWERLPAGVESARPERRAAGDQRRPP